MLYPLCRAIHVTSINLLGRERQEGDFKRRVEREKKRRREKCQEGGVVTCCALDSMQSRLLVTIQGREMCN